jgi:hypothetical protein
LDLDELDPDWDILDDVEVLMGEKRVLVMVVGV